MRAKVLSEDSRGYDALPQWVKDKILDSIVLSMIEYYGTQANPWDLDEATGWRFLELLCLVVKATYPDRDGTLDRRDKVYRFASL